jgi:DNA polymerase
MPAPKSSPGDGDVPLSPNPALDLIATGADLDEAGRVAARCKACELYRDATQVVFGSGSSTSRLMLIGEQPGDEEDLSGEPFVGPAGRLLDDILDELEIDRAEVYVTNAVKHFRWEQRGKRRLHQKPTRRQVRACQPWLELEIGQVNPEVIVTMGATATQALLGDGVRVTRDHGIEIEVEGRVFIPTVHPSSILRSADREGRLKMRQILVEDLRAAAHRAIPE